MMVSTKGRYALRVMLDLVQHQGDSFVSLKAIAGRQEISMKYLETIVAMLHKGGLIQSLRGKDGGYRAGPAAGMLYCGPGAEAHRGQSGACGLRGMRRKQRKRKELRQSGVLPHAAALEQAG